MKVLTNFLLGVTVAFLCGLCIGGVFWLIAGFLAGLVV